MGSSEYVPAKSPRRCKFTARNSAVTGKNDALGKWSIQTRLASRPRHASAGYFGAWDRTPVLSLNRGMKSGKKAFVQWQKARSTNFARVWTHWMNNTIESKDLQQREGEEHQTENGASRGAGPQSTGNKSAEQVGSFWGFLFEIGMHNESYRVNCQSFWNTFWTPQFSRPSVANLQCSTAKLRRQNQECFWKVSQIPLTACAFDLANLRATLVPISAKCFSFFTSSMAGLAWRTNGTPIFAFSGQSPASFVDPISGHRRHQRYAFLSSTIRSCWSKTNPNAMGGASTCWVLLIFSIHMHTQMSCSLSSVSASLLAAWQGLLGVQMGPQFLRSAANLLLLSLIRFQDLAGTSATLFSHQP